MSIPRTSQEQDDRLDMLAERYRSVEVEYRPLTGRVVARCFTASPDLDPIAALLRTVIIEADGTERDGCRWCGRRPAEGGGLCVVCRERRLDFAEDAREQTEPLFDEGGQARYVLLPVLAALVIAFATLAAVCATAHARAPLTVHRANQAALRYAARSARLDRAQSATASGCRRGGRQRVVCRLDERGFYSPMVETVASMTWELEVVRRGGYLYASPTGVQDDHPYRERL